MSAFETILAGTCLRAAMRGESSCTGCGECPAAARRAALRIVDERAAVEDVADAADDEPGGALEPGRALGVADVLPAERQRVARAHWRGLRPAAPTPALAASNVQLHTFSPGVITSPGAAGW